MKWSAKIIGNDLAERKIIANFVVPNLERSGLLKNLFYRDYKQKITLNITDNYGKRMDLHSLRICS